jgi:flagellar biosynthetic protein FliP
VPQRSKRRRRRLVVLVTLPLAALACGWLGGSLAPAGAAPAPAQNVTPPTSPQLIAPDPASAGEGNSASISIDFGDLDGTGEKKPGQSVVIILLLTVLAIAPALLVMLTSFTRIVIVLSLTRNALGLTSIPPNQVMIGLALFLSMFIMAPTLSEINEQALQPLLDGKIEYSEAYDIAQKPLRAFMLEQTRRGELNLFINAAGDERPETRDDIEMSTLIPAFVLSELKTAFIIGFVVFVPFLIIDLVVSSTLMSMGMFMLPPVLVSLPFKLLLFVMVDGWALVVSSLITSFRH